VIAACDRTAVDARAVQTYPVQGPDLAPGTSSAVLQHPVVSMLDVTHDLGTYGCTHLYTYMTLGAPFGRQRRRCSWIHSSGCCWSVPIRRSPWHQGTHHIVGTACGGRPLDTALIDIQTGVRPYQILVPHMLLFI